MDLEQASQDYWYQLRGSPAPPAPTFRVVNGKQRLGRYMDPFGCAGLMQCQRDKWHRWYPSFLVSSAIGPVLAGVGWVFVFLIAPFLAVWYLFKRASFRRRYDFYYAVRDEIIRTGQPVWVPYDPRQMKRMEKEPLGRWP
jgi:hypothetical protein